MREIKNICDRCKKVVPHFHTSIRACFNDDHYELCEPCTTELKIWLSGSTVSGFDIAGMKVLPSGMVAERH